MKPKTPKKILVVKLADLGDALLITPALRALRETFPQAQIEVLTTNGGPVLENSPYLDRVIYFDKYLFDQPREALKSKNLFQAIRFLFSLTLARYDTLIFFHHFTTRWGTLKYAALALATLAPVRLGLDNGRGWFLNRRVEDQGFEASSEREYWLELAQALGAKSPEDTRPSISLSVAAKNKADQLYNSLPGSGPVVAIHPGGGNYSLARRWLPGKFAEVANALIQQHGARIVLVGGPDEVKLGQQVIDLMSCPEQAVNFAGKTNIGEVSAFLAKCDLFIGNDAGLMHLATAVGTPVIAIFGPTNRRAWGPYGETKEEGGGSIVVQAELDLACRPCLYRGKELGWRNGCAARPCLTEIRAEQVLEAANKVMSSNLTP